jgi:hypothetical protein
MAGKCGVCLAVAVALLAIASLGEVQADTAFKGNNFAADGNLKTDWGIDLTQQTGGSWTATDLAPAGLRGQNNHDYYYVVQDDNIPTNHGGEAFDVEALYFAYDSTNFYFAMVTSVPPNGATDPYSSYQTYSDGTRRRFYPGDIALSVTGNPNPPPAGDGYEYGIVIAAPADSAHIWNNGAVPTGGYSGKQQGQVWRSTQDVDGDGTAELNWVLPDRDRAVDPNSFSNFLTTAGQSVYPAPSTSTELYYGQARNTALQPLRTTLPTMEGTNGGGPSNFPTIVYNGSSWVYSSTEHYGVPVDTYVLEAVFPRRAFEADNPTGNYYIHWTMGCANDQLNLNPIAYQQQGQVPEPISASFAAGALVMVIAAGVRRRRAKSAA